MPPTIMKASAWASGTPLNLAPMLRRVGRMKSRTAPETVRRHKLSNYALAISIRESQIVGAAPLSCAWVIASSPRCGPSAVG